MAGDRGAAILVTLSALCLPGPDGPVAAPGVDVSLDRMAWLGRPVVVTGEEIHGRRLPTTRAGRLRWLKSTLAAPATLRLEDVRPPIADRRDGPLAGQARLAWAVMRKRHDATWLITDRAEDTRPAHAAGLAVVQVGVAADDDPTAERPEILARDLTDAIHLLLAYDLFGGASSVA
jgi:hypothetical protein